MARLLRRDMPGSIGDGCAVRPALSLQGAEGDEAISMSLSS